MSAGGFVEVVEESRRCEAFLVFLGTARQGRCSPRSESEREGRRAEAVSL